MVPNIPLNFINAFVKLPVVGLK